MNPAMIVLLAQAAAAGATPVASAVTVTSSDSGQCGLGGTLTRPAVAQIAWTVTNPDPANFTVQLFENDSLVQSFTDGTSVFAKTIGGNVEYGPFNTWTSNWVYRIDVVRNTDGVVVSSASSAAWKQMYGTCS